MGGVLDKMTDKLNKQTTYLFITFCQDRLYTFQPQ